MEICVIQLNARHFRYYHEIKRYLEKEQADIVCIQEVATGNLSSYDGVFDPCATIAKTLGYHLSYGARYGCSDNKEITGEMWFAILSKYPIESSTIHYIEQTWPYRIIGTQESQLALGTSTNEEEKKLSYMIDQLLPSCILECVIRIDSKLISCVTTKFPASRTTDTNNAMHNHLTSILWIISGSANPTIIWLDCNITPDSYIVSSIEQLVHRYWNLRNTLNRRIHPWFHHWIPDAWFEVDYIFTTHETKILYYAIDEVDISDHLPVKAIIAI